MPSFFITAAGDCPVYYPSDGISSADILNIFSRLQLNISQISFVTEDFIEGSLAVRIKGF